MKPDKAKTKAYQELFERARRAGAPRPDGPKPAVVKGMYAKILRAMNADRVMKGPPK